MDINSLINEYEKKVNSIGDDLVIDKIINHLKKLQSEHSNNSKLNFILSVYLIKRKKISEAAVNLKKTIEIDDNHYLAHYHLGIIQWQRLEIEAALLSFKKSTNINPNFKSASTNYLRIKKEKMDLLTYLTFENPINKSNNPIIKLNQELQKIKYNIDLNKKISDDFIKDLYAKIEEVFSKENIDTELEASQAHRDGVVKYNNCNRHFEVFNTYNVIPEYCFTCYKVQILPNTVVDLIKLYFLFDTLKLPKNLTRKCMIELRPNIDGAYKGFIYCLGIKEAKDVLSIINPIIDCTIGKKTPRFIKRGCSEFAEKFPNYKETDSSSSKFMKYDAKWKEKEKIIDESISKRKQKIYSNLESLTGINLKDVLIIKNWLFYAKQIGDSSYKIIDANPKNSSYIINKVNDTLLNRIKFDQKIN